MTRHIAIVPYDPRWPEEFRVLAYAQVKRALARLHPEDVVAYYDVKDPVCDIIMAGAIRWAAETGYALGPSDL